MDFSNLFSVAGKTVVITGGSRGIGEMIAAGFLSSGAKVIISSRKAKACEETVERLKAQYGGEIYAIPSDVSNMDGVNHLAGEIAKREDKVDVLINNAGVAWGATLEDFPEVGWDKVMDVNVKGLFFLTQKLMPLLRKSASAADPARVINIASIDGMHTSPMSGFAYGTSKAAVIHLTRFMGAHLAGEHILVNAIAPGPFPTWMLSTGVGFKGETDGVDWQSIGDRNPSGRVGAPSDIAGLSIFLSSKAAAYITGHTIPCDGGIVASS
ncbi:SDR family oxidoreductase [Hyphomonas johnsonii]|uniref:Short-chain dehydrogenase/reductase SDR n=1 Tax=Hyphomonas johnsonii MHS-2 TaxID=1280950 RepID=A0A059FQB1_9PROT|nr:SDR family oxidoreductase [Hyphomonas johnsonii]KCZ92844.1 short-chain dehydrogenase/reductase SDR [Hyphomonas johnsonii MHS-2]